MTGLNEPLESHGKLATRAALLSTASNALLVALKITAGIASGSIAVLSDGLDSAEDLIASLAALISVRIAMRPATREYPYGYGKVEALAAAVEGGVIGLGGLIISYEAIRRLITGTGAIETGLAVGVMLISAAMNLAVSLYVAHVARKTRSMALASDARHLQTNVVQALAVLLGLGLVAATGVRAFDPLVALGLALFLFWTAFGLFRQATGSLLDQSLPPEELRAVEDILLEHREDVRGFHNLRSRQVGRTRFVELHVLLDPRRSLKDVHDVLDRIEDEIERRLPETVVTIHAEPDDGRYRGPLERTERPA
jgi:cation diffusion facilitator family transporter